LLPSSPRSPPGCLSPAPRSRSSIAGREPQERGPSAPGSFAPRAAWQSRQDDLTWRCLEAVHGANSRSRCTLPPATFDRTARAA
jgi:hypothetical protein